MTDSSQTDMQQSSILTSQKAYIKPRLWSDIRGNKIGDVFKGCAKAILRLIVMKPGITQVCKE